MGGKYSPQEEKNGHEERDVLAMEEKAKENTVYCPLMIITKESIEKQKTVFYHFFTPHIVASSGLSIERRTHMAPKSLQSQ